jgi:hypothetical protein
MPRLAWSQLHALAPRPRLFVAISLAPAARSAPTDQEETEAPLLTRTYCETEKLVLESQRTSPHLEGLKRGPKPRFNPQMDRS